jgi:hypothetical protein
MSLEMFEKYEPVVSNILRDKAHGWCLDYYNDKKTSYDVSLLRAQSMLELMKKEGELQKAQKTHAAFLASSKRPDARLKEDIKAIESLISQLKGEVSRLSFTSYGATRASSFFMAEDIINTLAYKQLLEKKRNSSLQRLRNLFMMDGDLEAMRQGVATIEENFTTTIASLSPLKPASLAAPVPVPVAAPVPVPVTEVVQSKRSRAYSEEVEEWTEPQLKGWRGKIKEWNYE